MSFNGASMQIVPTVTDLTILGSLRPPHSGTTIDVSALNNRLFQIDAGANVTIGGLIIVNGRAPGGAAGASGAAGADGSSGGAILNHGSLALTNVSINDSHAGNGGDGGNGSATVPGGAGGTGGSGGAVYNTGSLTLQG